MRRNILWGVLALALPIGTIAGLNTPASAGHVHNLISCKGLSGTMTFGTPISKAGVVTGSKIGQPITIAEASFNCGGDIGNGSDSPMTVIGAKNTKNPGYSKKSCKAQADAISCAKYLTGTQAQFPGLISKKTLKFIAFSIASPCDPDCTSTPLTFATKVVAEATSLNCATNEVGFHLTGLVKSPTYPDRTASLTLCLSGDSGPGTMDNFKADLSSPTAQIDTGTIDAATSKATL